MTDPVNAKPDLRSAAAGSEPVAYLKMWFDDGKPCIRVDLSEICEPWLDQLKPVITPLGPIAEPTPALAPQDAAGSEPVAWRVRWTGNCWQYPDKKPLTGVFDEVDALALHSDYVAAHESAVYWKGLAERHDERIKKIEAELAALRATPTPALAPQDEGLPNVVQSVFETDRRVSEHPRIIDLCYTAFMRAKAKNDEDGGTTDWFTDTKPQIDKLIEEMRSSFVAALASPPEPDLLPTPKPGIKTALRNARLLDNIRCDAEPDVLPGLKLALELIPMTYKSDLRIAESIRAEIARLTPKDPT